MLDRVVERIERHVRDLDRGNGGCGRWFVDWAQTLLGDRRKRLLTSSVGLDLLARVVQTS